MQLGSKRLALKGNKSEMKALTTEQRLNLEKKHEKCIKLNKITSILYLLVIDF